MHADNYFFPFDVLISLVGLAYVGSIQKYMSCKGSCLASVGADQPAFKVQKESHNNAISKEDLNITKDHHVDALFPLINLKGTS